MTDDKIKDDEKVLPFKIIDGRKADESPETPPLVDPTEQALITECWGKVAAILTEYNAQFFVDVPPIEIKVGEQVMGFNIPVKYGIKLKKK